MRLSRRAQANVGVSTQNDALQRALAKLIDDRRESEARLNRRIEMLTAQLRATMALNVELNRCLGVL